MFRKLNTKTILILFALLLVLVVSVNIFDKQKNERTFKDALVEVEANDINQVLLYPKSMKGEEIKLEKSNDTWTVAKGEEKFPADNNSVSSIINELNRIKPESVASTSEKRWKQYELTDSLATRVILKSNGKIAADIMIGKIAFSQTRKATSYIRLTDDKVVYGVDGYMALSFNRDINSFRNKTVIKTKKEDLTRLSFSNPTDGNFVLEKANDKWVIGSTPADSAAVAKFLSDLPNLRHTTFAEDKPMGDPLYKLKIEGNNITEAIEIDGYAALNDKLIITSNQNEGNYFDGENLKEKVFPQKSSFLKQ